MQRNPDDIFHKPKANPELCCNQKLKAMKKYTSAPLPFVGQKRMFVTPFKELLKQYPDDAIYVDLFGGSGLLSHITKREKPDATVIYNDFDNYRERLQNIERTNALLADLREIIKDYPRNKLISGNFREQIFSRIAEEERTGFVDYITLSSSLLFSMKYVVDFNAMQKESLYNTVRRSDYHCDGYLEGLEITSCDYKELFAKYKNHPNVVFLVDPPYLSTETGTYKMYWRLADYLDVLTVLQSTSFIYFTSNKSSILELCEWIGQHRLIGNPFEGTTKVEFNAHMNYNSHYTDIMLYKQTA